MDMLLPFAAATSPLEAQAGLSNGSMTSQGGNSTSSVENIFSHILSAMHGTIVTANPTADTSTSLTNTLAGISAEGIIQNNANETLQNALSDHKLLNELDGTSEDKTAEDQNGLAMLMSMVMGQMQPGTIVQPTPPSSDTSGQLNTALPASVISALPAAAAAIKETGETVASLAPDILINAAETAAPTTIDNTLFAQLANAQSGTTLNSPVDTAEPLLPQITPDTVPGLADATTQQTEQPQTTTPATERSNVHDKLHRTELFTAVTKTLQGEQTAVPVATSTLASPPKLQKTAEKKVEGVQTASSPTNTSTSNNANQPAASNGKTAVSQPHAKDGHNDNEKGPNDTNQSFTSVSEENTSSVSHSHTESTKHTDTHRDQTDRYQTAQQLANSTPSDQIKVHVTKALKDGEKHIQVELNPAELGRVDIRLEVGKDGNTHVMIMADRPETLDLLKKDASTLQNALSDNGVKTDAGSLNFSLRDGGHSDQQQRRAMVEEFLKLQASINGTAFASPDIQAPASIASYVGRINLNDRIDVRV